MLLPPQSTQVPQLIRLLIVDKEPAVRADFLKLCNQVRYLQVLGEVESGQAAIEAATSLTPDLMLIEVALPDMSGFDVLRHLGSLTGAQGIMTSNKPDFAERSFAEGAIDYLRKPVNAGRFAKAIERVRQRRLLQNFTGGPPSPHPLPQWGPPPKLLVGERHHRLYPLEIEKIEYIEADGNYVTIMAGNSEYISRDSIKRLAVELAPFGFVRIERSILLNIRAVQFAEPVGHGTLAFTLASGACLHSSRTYRDEILRVLPWHHCRGGSSI